MVLLKRTYPTAFEVILVVEASVDFAVVVNQPFLD